MARNDKQIRGWVSKLQRGRWYSGEELDRVWKVKRATRVNRIRRLVEQDLLVRKGQTSQMRYARKAAKNLALAGEPVRLPETKPEPSSMDKLVNAAADIAAENESMKRVLIGIRKTIDDALEKL